MRSELTDLIVSSFPSLTSSCATLVASFLWTLSVFHILCRRDPKHGKFMYPSYSVLSHLSVIFIFLFSHILHSTELRGLLFCNIASIVGEFDDEWMPELRISF